MERKKKKLKGHALPFVKLKYGLWQHKSTINSRKYIFATIYCVPVVISKRGKADLRYALYQAAMIASSRNPVFMRYFTDRMAGRQRERGIGTKIRVKMAAKMLVIAWTLMKRRKMFDPGCIN